MQTNKQILVTGGAGYIGSHTCKVLALNGYIPISYDNLSTGHRYAVKWGPLEEGDINDGCRLAEVIKQYKPEAVIHFAAHALVGESVANPAKYYRNNVGGTLTLLEAMEVHGIQHIVISSTCAVYGNPNEVPIPEDHPLAPINPYGKSKLMMESILRDFEKAYDIRHVSLRYFNAAGADPEGEAGEDHHPETHLIPLALQTALGQRSSIEIYGNDYSTPDGTCIRDYIHVNDLADAHVKALSYLAGENQSRTLNLGTGKGYSVREVVDTVREITDIEISEIMSQRREGDPPMLVAKVGKAEELLDWKPVQSDIKNILKTAWRWHNTHHKNAND